MESFRSGGSLRAIFILLVVSALFAALTTFFVVGRIVVTLAQDAAALFFAGLAPILSAEAALAHGLTKRQIWRGFLSSLVLGFLVASVFSAACWWQQRLMLGDMDWFAPLGQYVAMSAIAVPRVWWQSRTLRGPA